MTEQHICPLTQLPCKIPQFLTPRGTWLVGGIPFSKKQHQVLIGIIQGKANKIIAYEMSTTEKTIKHHVSGIYRKLKLAGIEVHNRVTLTNWHRKVTRQ